MGISVLHYRPHLLGSIKAPKSASLGANFPFAFFSQPEATGFSRSYTGIEASTVTMLVKDSDSVDR